MTSLLPDGDAEAGGWHDQMRQHLACCTFLPASSHKRFAGQLGRMHLAAITPRQWRYALRLAWRYRRQLPAELVPPRDLVPPAETFAPRPAKQLRDAATVPTVPTVPTGRRRAAKLDLPL